MAKLQIKNINHSARYIADWLIANPGHYQKELAEEIGMSEKQISVILHSDAFIEYYALRCKTHEERLSDSLIDRIEDLASDTIDKLHAKVQDEGEDMSAGVLADTAKLALNALGLGGRQPVLQNNVFVGGVDPALLAKARGKMNQSNPPESTGKVIDHEPRSLTEAVPAAE